MMTNQIRSGSEPPDFIACLPIRNLEADPAPSPQEFGGFRLPGIIDLHVHGGFGWDFSFGDPDRIEEMLDCFLRAGLSGMLPTLISCSEEQRLKALDDIVKVTARRKRPPALLGISLEGPFISPPRRGSHEEKFLMAPDINALRRWQDRANGMIRLVTLAPELPGSIEFIPKAQELNVLVTIGHTDADHETTLRAFKAGARNITHLYNAMRPFSQRDPTAVSAVLHDQNLLVELIADGIHVAPEIMKMTFAILGHQRISLVSDSVMPVGLPDGIHEAYDRKLELRQGRCTIAGGHLFGGGKTLPECLPFLHQTLNLPGVALCDCVFANPCRAIGIDPPREDVILDRQFRWLATRFGDTWYWQE